MPKKYQNKYRISSTRLQNWDYGWNASYFVTICTKNRECYFGKIKNSEMHLSDIGIMAKKYWHEIPQHFPFVVLDAFVVMPNHVHGIIIINKPNNESNDGGTDGGTTVETQNFASLRSQPQPQPSPPNKPKNKFGPQSKNLASIIRGYKIGVTKNARINNPGFGWQARFHDHIIRNDQSHQRIGNYIIKNPNNWTDDKFHK